MNIMILRNAAFGGLALLLAACGQRPEATGFITENLPPPEGAAIEDGDVPRDDAGRPFQYGLLGETLPAFSVTMPDGAEITDQDIRGQWMIVDFWGLWCPDCIVDARHVDALYTAVQDEEGLGMLSIHSPPNPNRIHDAFGRWESLEAYTAETGYGGHSAVDSDASAIDAFDLPWVPMYFLVDPEGTIRGFRSGLSTAGDEPVETFLSEVREVIEAG